MNQPQELTIKITPHELDIVMNGIMNEPWKNVANVIQKIMQQANSESLQAPAASPDAILPAELERAMKDKPGATAAEIFAHAIEMRSAASSVTVDLPEPVHPGVVGGIRERLAALLAAPAPEAG